MGIRIRVKPKGANDTSESSRNVGTAKILEGKVFVLSVFVAPYYNPWTSNDIESYKAKLFEAEKWLKMQALRYNKTVEFVNCAYGSDGSFLDNEIPTSEDDNSSYIYPSKVLLKLGFESREAFVDWVNNNTDCDQCLAVIFANTDGRSYASPTTKELNEYDPDLSGLECCLLYRHHADTVIETNSAVIAHEILHLFGAWDLYELDESDHERALKTELMFPNSIMLHSCRDIWESQIDEINAWLVGLKEEGKDWYRWFEPLQDSYLTE
jgi:hypothetical protein